MYAFDVAVTQWINSFSGHCGILDRLVMTVSTIGVPLMILAVAAQWWVRRDRAHVRHVLIAAGLSFLLGLGLNQVILLFLHRMRPYEANVTHLIISPTVDYSFPSDHATASFAIAAAFLLHGFSRSGAAFVVAALVIAFSRVYLGTHYLSDILGGAATAVFAACVVRTLYVENTRVDRFLTGLL
jgi:undecaprenyl-diphosphatase